MIYKITPCTKPRQTQRDKWLSPPRQPVAKYRAFKDEIRLHCVAIPYSNAHITFHLPMPKTWSKAKKNDMRGQPHQTTPDKDNLEKALLDAVYDNDCMVWDSRVTKLWADEGGIEIVEISMV